MPEGNKYAGNSKVDKTSKDIPLITNAPAPDGEEKKESAVIQPGRAVVKKPSLGKKLKENFVGEDANTVGSYLFVEVVVPAIKGLIIDVVQQGIVRAVGGNPTPMRIPGSKQHMGYSTISTSKAMKPDPREPANSVMQPQTYDQIGFSERGDAEVVLDRIFDQVREYGVVTVANFYEFAAVSNMNNFQDNKWGWNVDMLRQVRVQGTPSRGYFLNLPRPSPID